MEKQKDSIQLTIDCTLRSDIKWQKKHSTTKIKSGLQGWDSPSSTITVFSTGRVFHWKSDSQRLSLKFGESGPSSLETALTQSCLSMWHGKKDNVFKIFQWQKKLFCYVTIFLPCQFLLLISLHAKYISTRRKRQISIETSLDGPV